jgi:hypothetical protein
MVVVIFSAFAKNLKRMAPLTMLQAIQGRASGPLGQIPD